jgi:hypothetical protein
MMANRITVVRRWFPRSVATISCFKRVKRMLLKTHGPSIDLIVALLILPFIIIQPVEACAPAPRLRETVRILDESAIIVWNQESHTEHFIRRASFDTTGSDFGFLVPTPSKPTLAEVDNRAFDYIERLIKPRTIVDESHSVDFTPLVALILDMFLKGEGARAPVATARAVRVLDIETIAGYDAVVLEADNSTALGSWLAGHDYASAPDLNDWLKPYVAAHWKITAFKIAKGSSRNQVGTSAVRMSFATDRPLFPYSEPSSQRQPSSNLPSEVNSGRGLAVFFIGDSRVEGGLGVGSGSAWPGHTTWSDELAASDMPALASKLELTPAQLPQNPWMTSFEDLSSPRPGTADLYFARSDMQSPFPLPQVVSVNKRIPVPIDVILGLIGMVLLVRTLRKKRIRDSSP